jgi:hypothetical protein
MTGMLSMKDSQRTVLTPYSYDSLVQQLFKGRWFLMALTAAVVASLSLAAWGPAALRLPALNWLRAPASAALPFEAASSTNPETGATTTPLTIPSPVFQYLEVMDSCGPYYEGACVNMRSGPGVEYAAVERLRTGIVLRIAGSVEREGKIWYKITFDDDLRYPERVNSNWYVAADYVRLFTDEGDQFIVKGEHATTTKRIVVDISSETLSAYDGDTLFMQEKISTGLEFTPTPRGTFMVFKKTPSRYMQGPIKGVSDQYYDLPGVPWNLYFTQDGAVIHGAYWHDKFGQPWSHGCVNLSPQNAKKLYEWADVGIPVIITY